MISYFWVSEPESEGSKLSVIGVQVVFVKEIPCKVGIA